MTSLLRKMQDGAADARVPVSMLLLQAKVLAARLGHMPFRKWIDLETHGYKEVDVVPEYRINRRVTSYGTLIGPFQTRFTNIPLATAWIKQKEARDSHSVFKMRESIAAYEELLESSREGKGTFEIPWSTDVIATNSTRFYQGYTLVEAHIRTTRASLVSVVHSVRAKLLDFALEVEQENPMAGEAEPGKPAIPPEKVGHIFNITITGGNNNIAAGSDEVEQNLQVNVDVGNLESLRQFLLGQGVPREDMTELEKAIAEDPKPKDAQGFGVKVSAWVMKMTEKAASGLLKLGGKVATAVLTKGISKYYGWEE